MPFPLMAALSVGIPALSGYLRSRDAEKASRKNKRAIARANLQESWNPRAEHIPNLQDAEPSFLSSLAGAAETGLGAYNTFNQLKNLGEMQDLQKTAAKQGIAEASRRAEQAKGEELFAQQQMLKDQQEARKLNMSQLNPDKAIQLPEPPTMQQEMANDQVRTAQPASGAAAKGFFSALQNAQDRTLDQGYKRDTMNLNERQLRESLNQGQWSRQHGDETLGMTKSENEWQHKNAQENRALQLRLAQEAAERAAAVQSDKHNEPQWFTSKVREMQSMMLRNPRLSDVSDYADGMSGVLNGFASDSGAGFLNAIKGMVRLGGPGVVMPGEVATQSEAQGKLTRAIQELKGATSGRNLTRQTRVDMLGLSMEIYKAKMGEINRTSNGIFEAYAQNVDDDWRPDLQRYAEPYMLKSPEALVTKQTWDTLLDLYPELQVEMGGSATQGRSTDAQSFLQRLEKMDVTGGYPR